MSNLAVRIKKTMSPGGFRELLHWIIVSHNAGRFMSDESYIKLAYYLRTGRRLNLKNPKRFNEKLQWLKLNEYYRNDLITKCIDKYLVREFVTEAGCQEILNEL